MNLKQNHYTNFKCISYDITFDVDRIGTPNLLAPHKEWTDHNTLKLMSLRDFYIGFELYHVKS